MFRAYVRQQLIATLKPGDIVILDNLGSHKAKAIRDAIRAAGARLWFLPKYSPDLNPIEQAFAKIKHWMRQAQNEPSRNPSAIWASSPTPSSQTNASTISRTQDTLPSKHERLWWSNSPPENSPTAIGIASAEQQSTLHGCSIHVDGRLEALAVPLGSTTSRSSKNIFQTGQNGKSPSIAKSYGRDDAYRLTAGRSRTKRTFAASASKVNGLGNSWTPWSSRPLCMRAFRE